MTLSLNQTRWLAGNGPSSIPLKEAKESGKVSDGATKESARQAFGCPAYEETFGLRIHDSGFNDSDVKRDS